MWGELLDLAVPRDCPGCGAPGALCRRCRALLSGPPQRVSPRVPVAAPVWSCGPYAGPRRALVIAAKERGDGVARDAIGSVFAAAIGRLAVDGAIPHPDEAPPVLVPAPTRASAARRRGGDPVTAACRRAASGFPGAVVPALLRTAESASDSAGLSAADRRANAARAIVPVVDHAGAARAIGSSPRAAVAGAPGAVPGPGRSGGPVLLVDDVLTTGATVSQSFLVLASVGVRVDAVLVFAHA